MKSGRVFLWAMAALLLAGCGNSTPDNGRVAKHDMGEARRHASVSAPSKGAWGNGHIESLTADDYKETVADTDVDNSTLLSKRPLVVVFYSENVQESLDLLTEMASYAEAYRGKVQFYKLDVDEETEIFESYELTGLPVVFYCGDGDINVYRGFPDKGTTDRTLVRITKNVVEEEESEKQEDDSSAANTEDNTRDNKQDGKQDEKRDDTRDNKRDDKQDVVVRDDMPNRFAQWANGRVEEISVKEFSAVVSNFAEEHYLYLSKKPAMVLMYSEKESEGETANMLRKMQKLALTYKGSVQFMKLNKDANKQLAKMYYGGEEIHPTLLLCVRDMISYVTGDPEEYYMEKYATDLIREYSSSGR